LIPFELSVNVRKTRDAAIVLDETCRVSLLCSSLTAIGLINRSTKGFGPDANEFRPRRFFPSSDQSKPAISIPGPYGNVTTFGMGPRACWQGALRKCREFG